MHTPLVEHRLVRQLGTNDAAALIAKWNAQIPTGRMGDAWDVAHAVLFLASDEAKHITGSELLVDERQIGGDAMSNAKGCASAFMAGTHAPCPAVHAG